MNLRVFYLTRRGLSDGYERSSTLRIQAQGKKKVASS